MPKRSHTSSFTSASDKKRGPYRKHQPQRVSVASVLKSYLTARKTYRSAEKVWLRRSKALDTCAEQEQKLKSQLDTHLAKVDELRDQLTKVKEDHSNIDTELKSIRTTLDGAEMTYFNSKKVVEAMGYADWEDDAIKALIVDEKEVMPVGKDRAREQRTIFSKLDADENRARAIGYKSEWRLNKCFLLMTVEPKAREQDYWSKMETMKSFCQDLTAKGALAAFDYPVECWLYFGNPDLAYYVGPNCTEEHFLELAKYDDLEFMMRLSFPTKDARFRKMYKGLYATTGWKMLVAAAASADCSYRVFSYLLDYYVDRKDDEYEIDFSLLFAHWVSGFSGLGITRLPKTDIHWFSLYKKLNRFVAGVLPGFLSDVSKFDPVNSRDNEYNKPTLPWCYQSIRSVCKTKYAFQQGVEFPELKSSEAPPADYWKKLLVDKTASQELQSYRPKSLEQMLQEEKDYWTTGKGLKVLKTMQAEGIDLSAKQKKYLTDGIAAAAAVSSSSAVAAPSKQPKSSKPATSSTADMIDLSSSDSEEDEPMSAVQPSKPKEPEAKTVKPNPNSIQPKESMFVTRNDPESPDRLLWIQPNAVVRVGHTDTEHRFLNQASKLYAFLDFVGYSAILSDDPRLPRSEFEYVPRGDPKIQEKKIPQSPEAIHLAKTVIATIIGVNNKEWWSDAVSYTEDKYLADTAAGAGEYEDDVQM